MSPVVNPKDAPPTKKGTAAAKDEFHLRSPARDYDHNFAAGRVREMWTTSVCLRPFVPSVHARQLGSLFEKFPEVNLYRYNPTNNIQELLEFAEGIRKNENACLWTIFHWEEGNTWDFEPPVRAIVGIVGLNDFEATTKSIGCAYQVIFPPFQRLMIASHVLALFQAYAFDYLDITRLRAGCHSANAGAVRLGQSLRFKKDFTQTALGWPTREKGDADTTKDKSIDPRESISPVIEIEGSITWKEWIGGMGEAFANSIKCTVDSPTRFRNDYQPKPKHKYGSQTDKGASVPAPNFLEGYAPELTSKLVALVPMVPKLHAKKLSQLDEEVCNAEIGFQLSILGEQFAPEGKKGLLSFFERVTTDEHACLFVIYERGEDASASSKHDPVGFVVLDAPEKGNRSHRLSASVGPMVVVPSTKNISSVIAHSLMLLCTYVFSSKVATADQKSGLGKARFTLQADPTSAEFIAAATQIGIPYVGIHKFFKAPSHYLQTLERLGGVPKEKLPDGKEIYEEIVAYIKKLRGAPKERKPSVRDEFQQVRVWLGELTWWEWENSVKEAVMRVLQGGSEA